MSLWWARKEQLDKSQISLIEELPLRESYLVLGPPGSGKSNVLLRRAQFVRGQSMPNIMVLTFTRPLAEFLRTGCFDAAGREIFPDRCVSTIESWIRWLYRQHKVDIPDDGTDFIKRKIALAEGALKFAVNSRVPKYDALFIDEAQDLHSIEVELFAKWSEVLFFVGDDRQKIYDHAEGIRMADRVMVPESGQGLEATCHYNGPTPGKIEVSGPLSRDDILELAARKLLDQLRVYEDLLRQGDRLAVVVARTDDREVVLDFLENFRGLSGKAKIIRSKTTDLGDRAYDPSFDPDFPICIITVQGCKGIEFRAIHWVFCEELSHRFSLEHYYTVVTRAKTSLDLYYSGKLPEALARAYSQPTESIW
jgi:superfamily I DNA and RNA helicase